MRRLFKGMRTAENLLRDFVKSSLGRGRLLRRALIHRNAKIITPFCQFETIDAKRFQVLTDHSKNARVGEQHACDKRKCRSSCIDWPDLSLVQVWSFFYHCRLPIHATTVVVMFLVEETSKT